MSVSAIKESVGKAREFFVFDLAAMRGAEAIEPRLFTRVVGRDTPDPRHVVHLIGLGGATFRGHCRTNTGPGDATMNGIGRLQVLDATRRGWLALVDEDTGEILLEPRGGSDYRATGNVLDLYELSNELEGATADAVFPVVFVADDIDAATMIATAVGLGKESAADIRRSGGPVTMTRRQIVETIVALVRCANESQAAYDARMRERLAPEDGSDDRPDTVYDILAVLRIRGTVTPAAS